MSFENPGLVSESTMSGNDLSGLEPIPSIPLGDDLNDLGNLNEVVGQLSSAIDDLQSSISDNDVSDGSAVDTSSVSMNDLYDLLDDRLDVSNYQVTPIVNHTSENYYIPTQYLEYFKGIISWNDYDEHYVIYSRNYQYDSHNWRRTFYCAVSDDLTFNVSSITGTNCRIYSFDEWQSNYSLVIDDLNLSINSNSLIYTDLSNRYPRLICSDKYTVASFYLLITCVIFFTITAFGKVRNVISRRIRRRYTL